MKGSYEYRISKFLNYMSKGLMPKHVYILNKNVLVRFMRIITTVKEYAYLVVIRNKDGMRFKVK